MYIKYIYMQHVTMCSEMHNCKYCYVLLYSADLQRGDFRFRQCENRLVTAWQDTKSCSPWRPTRHQRRPSQCARREGMAGSTRDVPCPESIALYNQHMVGVDRGDQLRGYYPIRSKCCKFYKYRTCSIIQL